MLRGNFRRAWQYHPLGYLFIPVLFVLAGLSLLPATIRGGLARQCARHERVLCLVNSVLLGSFLLFGVVRFLLVLAGVLAFPSNS